MNNLRHFNIRVYGILLNENKEVLLSDEYVMDQFMTKFPGGGLILGEGPEDCILREAMEEFGQEAEVIQHFYTTGFFQQAMFFEDHQLISIYYRIRLKTPPRFRISGKPFDFPSVTNGSQSFRWAPIDSLEEDQLTFPIDRFVANLLKNDRAAGAL